MVSGAAMFATLGPWTLAALESPRMLRTVFEMMPSLVFANVPGMNSATSSLPSRIEEDFLCLAAFGSQAYSMGTSIGVEAVPRA